MKRVFVAAFVLLAGPAAAQTPVVCQTPWLWCGYASESPVLDGAPCACYSPQGPIPGRTIVHPATYEDRWLRRSPVPAPSAGQNPWPQTATGDNPALVAPPNPDPSPPQDASDRCLNGLGDCPGSSSAN